MKEFVVKSRPTSADLYIVESVWPTRKEAIGHAATLRVKYECDAVIEERESEEIPEMPFPEFKDLLRRLTLECDRRGLQVLLGYIPGRPVFSEELSRVDLGEVLSSLVTENFSG